MNFSKKKKNISKGEHRVACLVDKIGFKVSVIVRKNIFDVFFPKIKIRLLCKQIRVLLSFCFDKFNARNGSEVQPCSKKCPKTCNKSKNLTLECENMQQNPKTFKEKLFFLHCYTDFQTFHSSNIRSELLFCEYCLSINKPG